MQELLWYKCRSNIVLCIDRGKILDIQIYIVKNIQQERKTLNNSLSEM